MFQGLTQGVTIPIFFKNVPRVVDAKVLSVNTHMPIFNPNQPMNLLNGPVTDISVQVDGDTISINGLPANGVMANFPDKGYFVSTDRSAVLREVDAMLASSKQQLEQVPALEKMVAGLESLSLSLQPDKQNEVKRMQEIEGLRRQVESMGAKFDKIMDMLSANSGGIKKD